MAPVQSQLSRLEALPNEVLLHEILPLLLFSHGSNLARSSKMLYQVLIRQLYRHSGKHLNWFPLFHAAHTGNIATFQRSLEAGAPMNFLWPIRGDAMLPVLIRPGAPPLRKAIWEYQVDAVQWLLAHGANPNEGFDDEPVVAYTFRHGNGTHGLQARAMLLALVDAGADMSKIEAGQVEEIEKMRADSSYTSLYWLI